MTDKTGILRFYGKPVVDLKRPIRFTVTKQQSREGLRKNGELCPGALGIKATCKLKKRICTKAEVHRSVIYMDFGGDVAYRGGLSSSLRREVIAQDKGGRFDPGVYEIKPPSIAEVRRRGMAHSSRPPKHKRPHRSKRAKPHFIPGIRKFALSSKNITLDRN